jgi:hypothetical protein
LKVDVAIPPSSSLTAIETLYTPAAAKIRDAVHVPAAQDTFEVEPSPHVNVAVCVSAAPASLYVTLTVAGVPTASCETGPLVAEITGATFVTLMLFESLPVAPPPSVAVTDTTYVPSSSGVKPTDAPVPFAYDEPFFITDQAIVPVALSTSLKKTEAVTPAPSTPVDGAVSEATGASFTGYTVIVTVAVFDVREPSLTLNVKLSVPEKSGAGVYV